MFKFKMLTKVLVAVFFYGLIIELNLNLCIALSIDLSSPTHQIEPNKARTSSVNEHNVELEMQMTDDDQTGAASAIFASRTLPSASITTTITTTKPLTSKNNTMTLKQMVSAKDLAGRILVQRLESNGHFDYFGTILVGEQKEAFLVFFDLTSTSFWLPSSECKSNSCLGRRQYDRTKSATYKSDEAKRVVSVSNDRGLLYEGPVSKDTVQFAGATIKDQPFGEITKLEGDLLNTMPIDGFMGLGFKELRSSADGANEPPMTPVERLWAQGLLKAPIFSLKIKADVEQFMYSNDNGELILGEISSEYSPADLTYVPVTHADFWEFHLNGVSVKSPYAMQEIEHACDSACPAILDTRYAFIGGHFSDVDRINRAMGAYPVGNGVYRMSQCDLGLLPYLVFHIGDSEFHLSPEDYVDVRRIRGAVQSCYSGLVVVQSDQYPYWILGEYFLKRHYVVFDYGQKRIGFARSKSMTQELIEDEYGRLKKIRQPSAFSHSF